MADVARLLETLHPMREPPRPEAVTPYLLLLGLGVVAALGLLAGLWAMRHRRAALRRSTEAALAAARGLAPGDRLMAQADLLRRLARRLGGEAVARSHGDAWLAELDALFRTRFFTQGNGTVFGDALYRRSPAIDGGAMDGDAMDRALLGLVAKVRA